MPKSVKWLITGIILILLGACVSFASLAIVRFDFKEFNTVDYETTTYPVEEAFRNISVTSENERIELVPSPDGKAAVVCVEENGKPHEVSVEGDTLKISTNRTGHWFKGIQIMDSGPKITLMLPDSAYGTLSVNSDLGAIKVPESVCFDRVDIQKDMGHIDLSCPVREEIRIIADTSEIMLRGITTGSMTLKTDNGDVIFEDCDAETIHVVTHTGNVEGNFLTGKDFKTYTDTGDISVPPSSGGGSCEISTDTGDIDIEVP